jgi:hypothetical protein
VATREAKQVLGDDHNVYRVMDDLGRLGRVWREADDRAAER